MWGCALLLWTFLSRRGAYCLLDGESAVLLALLEVIDVEARPPVVDPPEWSRGLSFGRQSRGLRPLNLPPARGVAAAAAENVERGHSSCEWPSP